jgi:uncharacterized coiled-coil protein SlyX
MRIYAPKPEQHSLMLFRNLWLILPLLIVSGGFSEHRLVAQTTQASQGTDQESVSQKIQKLTESMARTQAQLEQSQRQLDEMRQELAALQRQMAQGGLTVPPPTSTNPPSASSSSLAQASSPATSAAIDGLQERQAMQESQIATHEQTKVESESKYPVKITGLLLLNGFVNTRQVDMAATPTVALSGTGSTGASVQQTILGLDARGPHLFGASSYADLRVDFDGNSVAGTSATVYTGFYNTTAALLRLRTAHAGLQWQHTDAYFSLDRPIFSPDAPTSLTAVAEPALAWSGNLWTWNPQVGVTRDFGFAGSHDIRLQGALMDVGDAPLSPVSASAAMSAIPPTTAEQSRWPGEEVRIALLGSKLEEGSHIGFGGYFAPHLSPVGTRFDAWAGTLDARLLLPGRLQFTGSFYRGAALGGLGGGAYKDFAYRVDTGSSGYYFRPLDDVGGWSQLKEKLSERVEFNAAFGLDNVFARELLHYDVPGVTTMYQNLVRNRTYTGNVIYSPTAYLLFSLEYRHLESAPVIGAPAASNIIGIAAGYKF